MHKYIIENESYIFSRIENTYAYKSSAHIRNRISKFIEYIRLIPEQKKVVDIPLTYSCTTKFHVTMMYIYFHYNMN